tara:strand:+ start:1499 stop:2038 length:540 start_codon:yes stop_codon:yes gene_type:complete
MEGITNTKMASSCETTNSEFHKLSDKWVLYAHLPHDTKWTIDSYKKILTFTTVEESISLFETIPEVMYNNCMLFMMRNEVKPVWEDVHNRNGGCLSFKVSNRHVASVWKELGYSIIGETASENKDFMKQINGITISPKRNFCILKIWLRGCSYKKTNLLKDITNLNKNEAIFKKHNPEY